MNTQTHAEDTQSARLARSLPHLLLFAVFGILLCLAELKSRHYTRLLQEDGWAEWATFSAFALAAFFGIRAAKIPSGDKLSRVSALLLGLFCVFVAGEEISWGQRLLGFRPPNFFLEQNYQQEANLHNLLKDILDTRFMVMAIALSFGVVAPFLAHVTRYPRALAADLSLLPWFTAVAWLEFSYPYELVGEFAELVLGLLFLIEMLMREQSLRAPEQAQKARYSLPIRTTLAQGAALASAIVIMPLTDAMLLWNREAYTLAAREDLATLRDRLGQDGLVNNKLLRKKRIHKRVYTSVRAGYLDLDPKRHYLDPWNNPYWLIYQRDASGNASGTAMLYSFGPNRRRDLPLAEAENGDFSEFDSTLSVGDDILVVVKLTSPAQAAR